MLKTHAACIGLITLLLAAPPSAGQGTADTSGIRAAAAELYARAKLLGARSDSLKKAADLLKTRADSILLASGLAAPPEPDHWSGSFGLGYTLNRGNSEQTSLVSTFDAERDGDKTRFISHNSVTNTTSEGGEKTNKGAFKNKFELERSEWFFFFAVLDADYNRQAGVNLRLSPGAGVGISAVDSKRLRVDFNFGANPVTEFLRDQPSRTKGHYLASEALALTLNGRTRLTQNVTWKPRFGKTEDYLLNFGITLVSQLTSSFDLKMTLEGRYDSRPPVRTPAVKRQDWMFFTSVSYNFW